MHETERQHPLDGSKAAAQPVDPAPEQPVSVVQLVCLSSADSDAAEGAEPDPPPRGKSPQPIKRSRFTLPIVILSALLGTYVVAIGVGYALSQMRSAVWWLTDSSTQLPARSEHMPDFPPPALYGVVTRACPACAIYQSAAAL